MTVIDIKGFMRQCDRREIYRGRKYQVDFVPKIKTDIAIDLAGTDQVVETARTVASTGLIGDGRIFVSSLNEVIIVRTGESGIEAI
jgi:nitrogen regulatory protein PII